MVQAPQTDGSATAFRFVGRRTRRADAPERLTGRLRFTNDLLMPGAVHVRFVRSPYAAARIASIDTSAALATPGVVAVLTARDLPVPDIQAAVDARRIMLALDNVLYAGHPVAAVLAESEAIAEDGVQAIQVDYEPLPAAVDVLDAMAADAPVVRQRREQDESELAIHGAATGGQAVDAPSAPNISNRVQFQRGDVEAGFRDADVVVERDFRTSWVHQGYLEPQSCTAGADPLGNLTVYASTQGMFFVRD
ncbi:MAG: xanthine dehydrogenase family protein molybdopterin-binding subunit, partial [Mycobacteriaceae bacterium]|nr:xanthine dehydrogenase family protein molybdopterin-binding subunit [Mycobacteriaceae bacterium]